MSAKKIEAVVRRKNKWYTGKISKGRFYKSQEIKRLSDVENVSDYVTLKRFLKKYKDNPLVVRSLGLDKLKADSVYILDTSEKDADSFERNWWSKLNSKCIKCSKECKQSSKIDLLKCPDFEEV
jgi:hypothetical protein